MTTIRPANVEDADRLAQLRWDFRVEAGTPLSTTLGEFVDEMRSFVGDLLAEGTVWRAWVAEDGDRVVGCVWIQVVERVPHPNLRRGERPIAYVTNMYVVPELSSFYRRAGFRHEDAPLLLPLEGD